MTPSRNARMRQGQIAEQRFRAWLDRCHLPHLFVEQSPMTIPQHLRGAIKRPDFLVGIPTIGTLAVDVKTKTIYDDTILIDAYEHRTLTAFETFFNMPVWFACFPPNTLHTCHLFLNRDLSRLAITKVKSQQTIAVPLRSTKAIDERRDFMAAVLSAIRLR